MKGKKVKNKGPGKGRLKRKDRSCEVTKMGKGGESPLREDRHRAGSRRLYGLILPKAGQWDGRNGN